MNLVRIRPLIVVCSIILTGSLSGQTESPRETIIRLYYEGAYQEVINVAGDYLASDSTAIDVLKYEVQAGILSDECDAYVADALHPGEDNYISSFRRLILLSELGRYWEAKSELDRISQTYEATGWNAYWRGRLAYDAGDDSAANELYLSALEDSTCRYSALRGLYELRKDRGELSVADSILQLIADIPSHTAWALSRRPELIGLAGDWSEALVRFEQLASEFDDSRIYSHWVYVTSKLGYYDRSIEICRTALAKWPNNKYLQNRLIWAGQRVGLVDESLELSEGFQPLHLGYIWNSTRMHEAFSLNDTLAIQTTAGELIDNHCDYSYPARRYLDWLDDRGRTAEADSLEEIISSTCNPIFAAQVKVSRIGQDRPDDALRVLDSLLPVWRIGSQSSRRFELMLKSGHRAEAETLADSLLMLVPGEIGLMFHMTWAEYYADNNEAAEGWLAKIDSLVPGSAYALLLRVRLAHSEDDRALTLQYLDSLSHQYPSWSELIWYYRDVFDKEDSTALASVTARFRSYPGENAEHIEELALNYARLEEYETADSLLAEGLVRHPQAADLYFYRGIVHDWAGNRDLADTYYSQAQTLDPAKVSYNRGAMSTTLEAQPLLEFTGRQTVDSTALVLLSVDSILAMAEAEGDVEADFGGLQLLDKRQIVARNEYRRLRRHHRVVKIVSDKAEDYYGTETLPFNAWREMPCLVLARVIRPDGEVINVNPSDVLVVGSSSSTTSDSRNVTWNYPRLDSGVVIEYIIQFELRHSEAFNMGYAYLANDWDPLRRWSVEVRIPDSWAINEYHTSGLDYSTYDSSGTSVYRWAADSLALLIWEENCPGTWDQGEWLRFAYRKTWREEADRYWRRVAVKFDTVGAVAKLARSLTDGINDKEDIIAALFKFVTKEIRYEAVEFGEGSIIPRPAPQVLENRYGDCKDKSTLLISLLKVHGIEAYPTLISSYDTVNFARNVPSRGFFNHMITYLPGEPGRFLDPTCTECGPYDLDIAYQGSPALVAGSDLDQPLLMTPPPTPEDKQYHRRTRMVVQEDGLLNLEIDLDLIGQTALSWKNYASTADTSDVSDWVKRYSGVGYWVNTEFLDYQLDGAETTPGLRSGWTSHMQKDSLFVKPANQVFVNLWFYSVNEYLSIPDTTDRTLDAVVGQRFHLTDEITIVPGSQWVLDNYRASWTMDTTWFTASSRATEWDDSIRIAVEFTLKTPRIPVEELASFARAIDLVQRRVMNQSPLFRRRPDAERIALIEDALQKSPGDLSLIMSLPQLYLGDDGGGQSCRARERRGKVRLVLSQALEAGTINESVVVYQASLLMADGLTLSADSLLKAYEVENAPSAVLQSLGAACAFTLADYEDAERRYRKLLEQVPDDNLRAQLATILVREQKVDEARSQIDLLETLKADSAVFMGALLNYYLELDSLDEAAELIEVWPDTTILIRASLKTALYERTGEYQEAYEEFAALLADDPDNAAYLNNCAWFMALGDTSLTVALEMIDKSMELTGHCNSSFGNTRGLVLLKMGRVDEARLEFESGLEQQSAQSFTINNYYLAKCALAEGKPDLARDLFRRACDANGDLMYTNAAREGLAELGEASESGDGDGEPR